MKQYILLALLVLGFSILYTYTLDTKLDLNGDNFRYIQLARGLSEGNGYNNISIWGVTPETHFPPGYPAFLSIFIFMGINSVVFFKVLNGLMLLAGLCMMFYMVRKMVRNDALAFASCLLPAFSVSLLHFSGMVMSEMLYFFLSLLCLFSLYKYTLSSDRPFWKSPWFYLAIIGAGLSYYVRAVGLATIFAVFLFFLFRKEWKQSVVSLVGGFLVILPWTIRNSGLGGRYIDAVLAVNHWRPEEGQVSSIGEFLKKIMENFDDAFIKGVKEILFPFVNVDYSSSSGIGGIIFGLLLLAVIFYGAWSLKPIRWGVIGYMIGNIGMVIIGTGGNGSRYVIPIAPLLFVCMCVGVYSLLKQFIFRKESFIACNYPYLFLLLAIFMIPSVKVQAKRSEMPYPRAFQNYFAIAEELQKQNLKGAVCSCRKPELFSYFAPDLFAVNYTYSLDPKAVVQGMIDNKVDFVILDQLGFSSTPRYLYPAVQAYPDLFPVVWELKDPSTYLLKFEREKAVEKLREIQ